MKARLFKDGDKVIINIPSLKYQGERFDECKIPEPLQGLERKDVDVKDIPKVDFFEQMYPDFEDNGEPYIKVDASWEKKLMPNFLIKEKELSSLRNKLKVETDPATCATIIAEYDEAKDVDIEDEVFWADRALKGLERADISKPEIEAKLKAKLGL